MDGSLTESPVKLNFFAELYANGTLSKGVNMRRSSKLDIGNDDTTAKLTIADNLTMETAAIVEFDLYAPLSDQNDSLVIDGDFTFANDIVFNIKPHLAAGVEKLAPGNYFLASVSGTINGTIENIIVNGISGTASEIVVSDNKLYLSVKSVRSAGSVVWNGTSDLSTWDLATSESFLKDGAADIFVDQDEVLFNDDATSKSVNIVSEVTPSAVVVDASGNYVLNGDGKISGNTTFTKKGSGKLVVYNTNDFTGKVSITGGEVIVRNLSNSIETGALGAVSTNAALFEIDGGRLTILNEGSAERSMTIGAGGAIVSNNAKLQWDGVFNGGELTIAGNGEMILAKRNLNSKTILANGSLTLFDDSSTPGSMISILNGSTFNCSNNIYSSNTMTYSMEIPQGESATINLDGRGYYTGKLLGGGTVRMNVPFVRTDMNGDLSEFSGTLNLYSTCTIYDEGNIRFNNSKGLPHAHVIVNPSLYISNESGSTLTFGALSGTGRLASNETYIIGAKILTLNSKDRSLVDH